MISMIRNFQTASSGIAPFLCTGWLYFLYSLFSWFFSFIASIVCLLWQVNSLSEIIKIWNSPNSPKLPNNTIICLKDMNFWMHWHLWFKLSVLKYHFCLSTGNYVPEKKSFNNLYLKGTSKSCVLHNLHVFSTVVEKIKEWHGYNISWIFIMLGFF